METVAVLMSTYNGEAFLKEQLDSILSQININVELYIRDDGSQDKTPIILKEYMRNHSNVHVYFGKNMGVFKSFEWLVRKSPLNYDYYAFSDQDDIWLKEKLSVAITKIQKNAEKNTPILYFCNQSCVNEKGEFLYKKLPDDFIQPNIITTILDNQYSGCTMVFNKALLELDKVTYNEIPHRIRTLYDSWLITIAQITGILIYDSEPYIKYRRHGNNETTDVISYDQGLSRTLSKIRYQIKNLKKYSFYKNDTKRRCIYILTKFDEYLSDEDRLNLTFLSEYNDDFSHWIRTVFHNPLKKHFGKAAIATWVKLVIGMY